MFRTKQAEEERELTEEEKRERDRKADNPPTLQEQLNAQNLERGTNQIQNTGLSGGVAAGAGYLGYGAGGASGLSGASTAMASTGIYAAWAAAAIGLYVNYRTHKKLKEQGIRLTNEEAAIAYDPFGLNRMRDKYLPQEYTRFTPKELRYLSPIPLDRHNFIVGNLMGSKKSEGQVHRDNFRTFLDQRQIAVYIPRGGDGGKSHHIQLADGSLYDIGLDGHDTIIASDGNQISPYNVDTSNPLAQQTVGFLNPVMSALSGGNSKVTADMVGYFANAAMSNATTIEEVKENVLHMYRQIFAGFRQEVMDNGGDNIPTEEMARGFLQAAYDEGVLTEEEYNAFSNGINQLYDKAPLTAPGTPIEEDPAFPVGDVPPAGPSGFPAIDDGVNVVTGENRLPTEQLDLAPEETSPVNEAVRNVAENFQEEPVLEAQEQLDPNFQQEQQDPAMNIYPPGLFAAAAANPKRPVTGSESGLDLLPANAHLQPRGTPLQAPGLQAGPPPAAPVPQPQGPAKIGLMEAPGLGTGHMRRGTPATQNDINPDPGLQGENYPSNPASGLTQNNPATADISQDTEGLAPTPDEPTPGLTQEEVLALQAAQAEEARAAAEEAQRKSMAMGMLNKQNPLLAMKKQQLFQGLMGGGEQQDVFGGVVNSLQ